MADQALAMDSDADKPARRCVWCGVDVSHRNRRAAYCSNLCKKRSYRDAARIREKTCHMCGQVFRINDPRGWKKSVCSSDCWKAWDRLKHAKRYQRPLSLMGPLLPLDCQVCGGHFISWNGRAGYCSTSCKQMAWRSSDKGTAYLARFAETGWSLEWRRRRAAERALALLLMPVHQTPEAK